MERNITLDDFNKIIDSMKDLRDWMDGHVRPEINEALRHLERAKFIWIEIEAAHARERQRRQNTD
ncbi:hypothetical protein LEP1GSC050_0069 [Leptospira phage vB_LbrZ_5399-LE1]|uniref:Uncharacterized protein n=1 Tax=Leptospira inadai serovar Lyme TaxID=293084 RepID=A0ABX4YGD9_9LEPT|nr:hypothetical protein [Leptospira inadai]AGS80739.1 hypothetical protein LEP1GSC050_0069 [Leptospira phage vB_LbrZ_5399-LE1]AGS80802.1 hypothetical protein LEP1GSC047_0900 [Leptospira phage vB_LinZ_10-LE1]PNV74332.1 hypothetical protein BES34_014190 [Leptospira inadai serovar Lyme]